MADGQIGEIIETVRPVLATHGVRRAGLFGSAVEGDLEEGSDVDILVQIPPDRSLLDLVALKRDLEEALGREVDIVEYETIHPRLKDRILDAQVAVV